MLYLAEIQKQSKGFMGGVEAKLKLLACQRNDRSWSIVNNESITISEAIEFGDGALIAVNLSANRQVQGNIELASPKIINILKNFSRLLEKTKDQEQEIEQWKESLERQSEELSIRQIEMETRLEQVEQMEAEFKQFEQQRAEIDAAKAESDKIREEFEVKSLELQGAWEQLRGQQQNLEERLQEGKVLDESQAAIIKSQLEILAAMASSADLLQDKLNTAKSKVQNQQSILQPHWQKLDRNFQEIEVKRQALESKTTELASSKQELTSTIITVAQTQKELEIQEQSLQAKQKMLQFLNTQSAAQSELIEVLVGSESDSGSSNLNLEELENMPLPNLQKTVENLKNDLEKVAKFVNDQEEELGWQCKAVEELEQKIAQMGEFERLTVEQELADELEAKKMLDKTLVGQRRSLKERHHVLLQHSRVLKRRQGIIDFDFESEIQDIDLEPIKQGLTQQHEELQLEQQNLVREVAQIEAGVKSLNDRLQQQQAEQSQLESAFEQQQQDWQSLNFAVVQMQLEIDFYQQQLQPLQDAIDALNEEILAMEQSAIGSGAASAVTEISKIVEELMA